MRWQDGSERQAPERFPGQAGVVRNASVWVTLSVSRSSQWERRRALGYWLIANKLWTPIAQPYAKSRRVSYFNHPSLIIEADRTVEKIRLGQLDPYDSANRTIDFLRQQNKSNSTILGLRSFLLRFLRYSRLGMDPEDLKLSVKKVPRKAPVLALKLPSRDQVRSLLLVAPLKVRVLISMLVCTGARIGEVRNLRALDVDFNTNPVRVHFRVTKTGVHRIGFLGSETTELLRQYLKVRKHQHEYIFDGYMNHKGANVQPLDRPLSATSAWGSIARVFRRLHMDERFDGVHHYYHPHVFRTLCLSILKTGGYPSDWAEYLAGHDIGTQAAYLPPAETLGREWLKLGERFCFLGESRAPIGPRKLSIEAHETVRPSETPRTEKDSTPEGNRTAQSSEHHFVAHRWASNSWVFVKARIDSIDYDQALAEGYAIFDKDGPVRVLRKRASYG